MHPKNAHDIVGQVKASYKAIAGEFDQTRQRPWTEFEGFLGYIKKGARVLDLGCGNGRLCGFLEQKEVEYVGVDHNEALLKKAQENHPNAIFEHADMVNLELDDERFDNVFCIAAFHHIPSKPLRKKALKDIHRSLKKDGVLILTTWNLFQWKYVREWLKGIGRSILTLGRKGTWNDLWIKWGKYPLKRYYHSFLPGELRRLFKSDEWTVEAFYFTKKGKMVKFLSAYNIIVIARKK